MSHDLYQYKRSLIEQNNREAENARIEVIERAYTPLYWVFIAGVFIAVAIMLLLP